MRDLRGDFRWLFLLWTFPGVVIHELAHKEFCRYYRIPVKEVCYFQLGEPAGYVIHARPKRYIPAFFISVSPVIVNVIVCLAGGWLFAYHLLPFPGVTDVDSYTWVDLVLGGLGGWVGFSAGVHALPSKQDAYAIWQHSKANWYNPFVLVVIPLVAVIWLLNIGRKLYLHIGGAVAVFLAGVYLGLNSGMLLQFLIDLFTGALFS